MIVVYQRISDARIRKEAKEAIPQIEKWFAEHPERNTCLTQFWYQRFHNVRRGHVAEDVKSHRDAILNEHKQARKNRKCSQKKSK